MPGHAGGDYQFARWMACAALALGLFAYLMPRPAAAEPVRIGGGVAPRIVNGIEIHGYPTVGALLYGHGGPITLDNAGLRCSGTLIGCRTFLTAAHCVEDLNPARYLVYLQHGGFAAVTAIARHPDYFFPVADVAVLELGDWVTGIAPSLLSSTDPVPYIPAFGVIVGFGQTQGGANDYGIKRGGVIETMSCPFDISSGATDAELICWAFTAPLDPPGTDSNTCNGDSGGPLFIDFGDGQVVAGVTSGGSSATCLADDISYDASVYAWQPFLLAQLGSDDTAVCGGLPAVGEVETTVIPAAGTLGPLNPSDTMEITVPAGTNLLRVTLNGQDNGIFDADLYVREGTGAGPANFDCAADGGSPYGACTFEHPAPGTWSIAAVRTAGTGRYQVTATVFGGATSTCGNGTREFDEECDGADASRCAGLCQGDCTCPVPVCGNGVRESGEGCDGSDAPACPGQCEVTCQCPVPCDPGDLYEVRARLDARRLRFRARLLNFDGVYNGADPRNGFSVVLSQGANVITIVIPPGDPGWAPSVPARGRYIWRGASGGMTRIKLIDRSARQGVWKVVMSGRDVPGAAAFDPNQPVNVRFTLDGRCTDDSF